MDLLKNPPSTTITWATIAGSCAAGVWGAVDTFTAFEPSAGLVGSSVAVFSGVVGKLVRERRYTMTLNK